MSNFPLKRKRYLAVIVLVTLTVLGVVAVVRPPEAFGRFRSFDSYYQLRSFVLLRAREYAAYLGQTYGPLRMESLQPSGSALQSANTFTTTNVQVEGVDEPDIVKTDGAYLYVLSQNKVFLILAYPPDGARIVSKLDFQGTAEGVFVSQDRLAVIETAYPQIPEGGYYGPVTILNLYDISDKTKPSIIKEISIPGSHVNSRLTAGYIYAIIQQPAIQYAESGNLQVVMPTLAKNHVNEVLPLSNVYYSPASKAPADIYTIAVSVRITDGASSAISVLTGPASTIFASFSNIYVTFPENPIIYLERAVVGVSIGQAAPAWGGYGGDTTIFRLSIGGDQVNVAAAGTVAGGILNQFSMDEYNGYFRVATTSFRPEYNGGFVEVNNVYVLDQELNVVGRLEGLASKERIYAVRFLGEMAYVVTFEKVDPLFAISLENPQQPKLLGELIMPGFSQYLHPIGQGYLIGVGKEAVQAQEGDFAWYQGLKLSIFKDDGNGNLVEVAKFLIGDRGSDSPVLYDHKAFTYDPQGNMMALPLLIAQINENSFNGAPPPNTYGDPVWQGAYVFHVSPENGFELLGKVTHIPPDQPVMENYSLFVNRVVLIGDFVYTVSETAVRVDSSVSFEPVVVIQLQGQ